MDYPLAITTYLLNRTAGRRHPAYFRLDRCGRIDQWGGALEAYGVDPPGKGRPIEEVFAFTEGLFPMDGDGMQLECIHLPEGHTVDAHFFAADGGHWLLILDATEKSDHRRLLQQKANDLQLLRDRHSRILNQHLGKGMARHLLDIDPQQGAERRILSVLFADICGFTAFCENRQPGQIFDMLNTYLTAMIRPVLDGGGIIDKIIGDAVMAVFGLVPSSISAAEMAVDAAEEILQRVKAVAADREAAGQKGLSVGIGIASGAVVLGLLGSRDRRTLSVTGHPVNLAARLEGRAGIGEILIDPATHDALPSHRSENFSASVMNLRGMACATTAYSWIPDHEE